MMKSQGKTAYAIMRGRFFFFLSGKIFLQFVIVLFLAVFSKCASTKNNFSVLKSPVSDSVQCVVDTKYPVWFFNPPPGSITGFYRDTVTSQTDATIRKIGYGEMRVVGALRYFDNGKSDDFQDSIRFYYQEPQASIADSLVCIDSFFMCCSGNIRLLAPQGSVIDTAKVNVCNFSKDLPKVDCPRLIATGEYRFEYYHQSLCWMHAEENAVKELCNRAMHWFAALQKKSGAEISTVMMKRFDLSIKNIRIEQRKFEANDNICNVTISCDTTDIIALSQKEVIR
jgi:hypothetical protein